MRLGDLRARAAHVGPTSRCAFCHGAFARDDDAWPRSCGGCGTLLHAPCWRESGRCTTLGCRGPGVRVRAAPAPGWSAWLCRAPTSEESVVVGAILGALGWFLLIAFAVR